MSINARLLGAIWVATLLVMVGFTSVQIETEQRRIEHGLETRASLLAEGLKESVESAAAHGSTVTIQRLIRRFGQPDLGIAVYDRFASLIAGTPELTVSGIGSLPEAIEAITKGGARHGVRAIEGRTTYVYATPFDRESPPIGALVVLLDGSSLDRSHGALWLANALHFCVLALVLSLVTLFVVHSSITEPLTQIARWTRTLKTGQQAGPPPEVPDARLFGPLALEVSGLASSLHRARRAAEREAALRIRGESIWTEERLKQFVSLRLNEQPLTVVSNREPVSHMWQDGKIVAVTPASGLVTAMDPLLRACGGVWIAHGSGDADPDVSDPQGRLALPADDPRYTLRRVWLSPEEAHGYYDGFANEGLWPLCHIVHTRPLFRPEDWRYYLAVNQRFAAAVLEETEKADAPLVLIQDYHFALLPALIKTARPDARVALFWHIPWPNSEAFGICPWQREILEGMLGADLIGFHTQFHCNNFLETVERAIECRVDWEHFSVVRTQHATAVKPLPISVTPEFIESPPAISRQDLVARLGLDPEFLGVGVDRIDYTKGLPERFLALQRFFERYPAYRERLVFVQLAAPSRSQIKRYQELQLEIEQTVDRVNRAVGTRTWRPIVYMKGHHDRPGIWPFYRHADFCMVTSLHDGMNLVAKEFVSVRDDEDGVLILSRFTGGARELRDALVVNPYDLDEMAEAIRAAIEMPPEERAARMARMRQVVSEHNIYWWAGLLLSELAGLPAEPAVRPSVG
jgi:trehalose-6-phosphate synthase/HAMP domain-containing protein